MSKKVRSSFLIEKKRILFIRSINDWKGRNKMVRFVNPGFHENCSLNIFLKGSGGGSSERIEEHEVKPCKSEKGEYLIESNLVKRLGVDGLDEETLEFILDSNSKRFLDMNNSEDLGVFDIDWERHKIKIYSSGKVEVRQGTSKEKMKKILENIEKLIIVSLRCENCNQILLDCIGRKCSDCSDDSYSSEIELDDYFRPLIKKSLENLIDGYENLPEFGYNSSYLKNDINIDESMDMFRDAFRAASNLIINSNEKEIILIGWSIQSLIFDNFRLLKHFNSFSEEGISGNDTMKDILEKSLSINERMALLHEGSEVRIQDLIRSSKELEEDWNNFQRSSDMQKFKGEFNFVEDMISSNISQLNTLKRVYF